MKRECDDMKKKIIAGLAVLLCGSVLLQQGYVGAQNTTEKEPESVSSRLPEDHVFKRIDAVSYTHLDVYKRQMCVLSVLKHSTRTILSFLATQKLLLRPFIMS